MTIFDKIQELEGVAVYSKHDMLVNGITNAIDDGIIYKGSNLPSINVMVSELGFARKTIVKAYNELKEKGIVESKKRLGYFVASENTTQELKVAVLLYAFHLYQEEFYNTLRNALGKDYQLDVFFHHNNMDMFKTILDNIKQKYGMYVIAPITHEETKDLLKVFPENKLLIVDRFEDLGANYSYISQEFFQATWNSLVELLSAIRQYKKIILFYDNESDQPNETLEAFKLFFKNYNIQGEVKKKYTPNSVGANTVYFITRDNDLWKLLKDCKYKELIVGRDVGVVSFNEEPVKELVLGGITTISTDFELIGNKAAEFVKERKVIREIIPTTLIRRNSL